MVGATIVMNQELTKAKVEGVMMEVAKMGQQIDHMDETFNWMEKKVDKLLIQRFAINSWPLNRWHQLQITFASAKSKFLNQFPTSINEIFYTP